MSKKKEKKLRKLRHVSFLSAIVGMLVKEFLIILCSLLFSVFSVSGLLGALILDGERNNAKVVAAFDEPLTAANRRSLREKISALNSAFDTVSEVYLLNSDFTVAETFGNSKDHPDFSKIFSYQNENSFEDFTYDAVLVRRSDSVVLSKPQKLYKPGRFFLMINPFVLLENYSIISWALTPVQPVEYWTLHKAGTSGFLVCIKNSVTLNTFHLNFVVSVLILFATVIIFCGIYEISKIFSSLREQRRINQLVITNPITGGYNKEYFMDKSKKLIAKGKKSFAVVQLRLEKYRNFCTAYGLKQGEALLEQINSSVQNLLEKPEFVAHLEKADFALFLVMSDEIELEERLHKIMRILNNERRYQHLNFSAGVCGPLQKSDDIAEVLTSAGIAIPKVCKSQNAVVWFNDSMKDEQLWERRIEDDMEAALKNKEFHVFLQPKYSTKTERIAAAEALIRWKHPVLGLVPPGKFIPIFERDGFILQIDDYMISEVARLQAKWRSDGRKLVPISVNVSRAHFAEENLAEHICALVDKYKVPHKYIELELTESAFFDDKAVLLNTVRELKFYGFKVSMDDFGAGYSSLNSLKELPLDIIKLDAEFFRSVDDIERSKLIVQETIILAKKLGMQIVAEGIENREQVDFLAAQDCDLIQGFYFSKPLPIKEFEARAYS